MLRLPRSPGEMRRRTHCEHGHAFTPENTRRRANGARVCRTCHNEQSAASKRRRRAAG